MAIIVVFLLLIFLVNAWLALSALQAVATGVVRMYGKSYRRDRENYEFWFSIASKATAAIILFLYMTSVVSLLPGPQTPGPAPIAASK